MRFVTQIAAIQLGSVAERYRRVVPRVSVGSPSRQWLGLHWKTVGSSPLDPADDLGQRQRVEAVLLLAREPLNSRRLAHFARLTDGTAARTQVRHLNQLYDETGRAFRVEEVAGGFRLLTRRQFAPWLRRLEHVPAETRLSAPAMETLAVVAYRQPVLRAEIEAIRGVSCGEILRQLMERDLVRIGGRSDDLGRPYLYTTTRRFLQLFGLQNLEQLPRAEFIREESEDSSNESVSEMDHAHIDPPEEEMTEVTTTSIDQVPANDPLNDVAPEEAEMSFEEEIDDFDFVDEDEDDDDDEDEDDDEDDWDDEEEIDDDYDESEWEEVEDDEDWDDEEDDWEEEDEEDEDED